VNIQPWVDGPSGEIAYYRSGGSISTIELDAADPTPTQIVSDANGAVAWSSDGSMIAFTRGDPSTHLDLWVASADGTGARQLTDHPGHVYEPTWSPDGTKIAFHSDSIEGAFKFSPSSLSVVNSDGTGLTELVPAASNLGRPAWSPDSRQIAFLLHGEIKVVNADGSGSPRSIVKASDLGPVVDPFPKFRWLPDGRTIVFVGDAFSGRIYVARADGSHPRQVARVSASALGFSTHPVPSVSPDGKWIVLGQEWSDDDAPLFLLRIRDGSLFQITGDLANEPAWRPEAI
jgi:TolB protein